MQFGILFTSHPHKDREPYPHRAVHTRVTDEMMRVAAATLGEASPALADPNQPLLPAWSDVPDIAVRIAHAVGVQAVADGVASKRTDEELTERIAQVRWSPDYPAVPA